MAEWAGTAEARSRVKTRAKSIAALPTWDVGLQKTWWRQVWRKNAKCNSPMPLATRSRSVFTSTPSERTPLMKKRSNVPSLPHSVSNRPTSSNSLTFFIRFIPRPQTTATSAKSTIPISRGNRRTKRKSCAAQQNRLQVSEFRFQERTLMAFRSFEDLEVWQRGCRLAVDIFETFSSCRNFTMQDQIQRAALSIPSNVAEGYERDSNKEFVRFLNISKGSCGEL